MLSHSMGKTNINQVLEGLSRLAQQRQRTIREPPSITIYKQELYQHVHVAVLKLQGKD